MDEQPSLAASRAAGRLYRLVNTEEWNFETIASIIDEEFGTHEVVQTLYHAAVYAMESRHSDRSERMDVRRRISETTILVTGADRPKDEDLFDERIYDY